MGDAGKDTKKNVDDIIEETLKDIYDDINSDHSAAGLDEDNDDIEFIEMDLDEDFTTSSREYFSKRKEQTDEEDGVEKTEESEDAAEDETFRSENSEYVEDDEDFGEAEFEDNDEKKARKRADRRRRRGVTAGKAAAVFFGSFFLLLAMAYMGGVYYFGNHLFFQTTVNGIDFSTKSIEQVEDYMRSQVSGYALAIEESDGDVERIEGAAIDIEYVPGDEVRNLMAEQNKLLWIESLWKKTSIETSIGVKYNEKALAEKIEKLQCLVKENQVKSVNAHPEFKEDKFVIIPEVIGTQIKKEEFSEAVAAAINGFQNTLKLEETDCYKKPTYLKDSEKVVKATEKMNSYLGASVTYDFNPYTEVVDASVISQWVKVSKKMKVTFDKEAVRKYVASLAEKYDTIAITREFTTANGNNVSVQPGTYGWEMDQETEYNQLLYMD